MKIILKMCRTTIKQTRLFSAGLLLIFMFATAISFIGVNFAPSCEKSSDEFSDQYGMADACYVSYPLPIALQSDLESVKGVKHVDPRFVLDLNASADDGSVYSFRVFRYDENSLLKQKVIASLSEGDEGAVVSDAFAENNPLKLGDELAFKTAFGEKRISVTAFAYNPETRMASYDELSYCENGQFGYVYIPMETYDTMFGTRGISNSWMLYFDDDIDPDGRERAIEEIRNLFGEHILSEITKNDYQNGIHEAQKTVYAICGFIPFISYSIAVVFSLLLLWQVIDNQQKTIGLLRAIGYTVRQTTGIYILYTLLITALAVIAGIALGYVTLDLCVEKYSAVNRFAESRIEIRYAAVALLCAATFICAVLACLLCAAKISSVDPCKAYGGMTDSAATPSRFVSRLRLNVFFKVSLTSIFKNKKRILLSSVCIAVCIFCMSMILEVAASSTLPIDEVFGGRYRYTLLVHGTDGSFVHEAQSIEGVEKVEQILKFSADMSVHGSTKNVTVNGIASDSELVVLKNALGSPIAVRDGIVIEEMFAKENQIAAGDTVAVSGKELEVTAIARELVNSVMFVSLDTARSLSCERPADIALLLSDEAEIEAVKRKINELDENAVIIEQARQRYDLALAYSAMQLILVIFLIFVFGIGTFIVFNMAIINFREKVTHYATLRVLGTPDVYYGIIFAIENMIQFLLAVLIACPVSYFGTDFLLKAMSSIAQQFVMTHFGKYLSMSILISLGYVLTGIVVSLFKVRKMDPLHWLNQAE